MSDHSIAAAVTLRDPHDYDPSTCAAWMESAERICGKPTVQPWLCIRHVTVAKRRIAKQATRDAEKQARADAEALRMLPKRRARLDAINAEIARRDPPPPTTDLAAFGGVGSTTARRYQQRVMSDSNISRMAALWDERRQLEPLVAWGERVAAQQD